ncbi:MAG: hypothetical protein LBU85_11745 [Treponema sp.]|jgi:phenylalanyl-tRNA synthetase beta chain|nr:hypothetical protein [Treponema sp.]
MIILPLSRLSHFFKVVAYLDSADNSDTTTLQYAGFLHADKDANFNTAAGQIQTLFYYL